jgi:chitinase
MKDFSRCLFKLSFLFVLFGLCAGASAQCKYTTLHIPGALNSAANGINDQGAIVGVFNTSLTEARAFLLFQGKFTQFNFPGAVNTVASDINNHGQIVGAYVTLFTGAHGFVVHNSVFHSIDAPQPPGDTQTQALGINNFGVIVGNAGAFDGFRLSSGHFTTVRFPGSSRTSASSINDSGAIVGFYRDAAGANHGFMLKNGHYTAINFPGADDSFASHINNEGDIVGFYEMHGDVHGFTLDKGRFLTHDDNAGFSTVISGVNKFETIVGNYVDTNAHNQSFKATCTGVF